MSYLDHLDQNCPIRNTAEEKEAFRAWAIAESDKLGFSARTEQNDGHDNIVIGDPESAKVLFTAHYDTPKRALTPNLMLPENRVLFWVYNLGISFLLVGIAILAGLGVRALSGYGNEEMTGRLIWLATYTIVFIGLFKIVLFGPKNEHNRNDNTSGAAVVMELCSRLKGDKNAAFILFDNEEKGKKGSKAYAAAHIDLKESRLVVNMDCVGNGDTFMVGVSPKAKESENYPAFERAWQETGGFTFRLGAFNMNSDQKSFTRGVGVCACRKYKVVGYCTPRIHTKYDTMADDANIGYLCDTLERFVKEI